ncbi:MAG: hypothetical protein SFU91_09250 [Chloroherpetonaceae bacterium]|nr:hypothetical protein [Chloroherpetonaceae bacterium]
MSITKDNTLTHRKIRHSKSFIFSLLLLGIPFLDACRTTEKMSEDEALFYAERNIIFLDLSMRLYKGLEIGIRDASNKQMELRSDSQKTFRPTPVMISNAAIANSIGRRKTFQEDFTSALKEFVSSNRLFSLRTHLNNETALIQINPRFSVKSIERSDENERWKVQIAVAYSFEISLNHEILKSGVDHFIYTAYAHQENAEWLKNEFAEDEAMQHKSNFWGEILIPLTVSSAVGIIVYLFFSVRTN